MISSDSGVLRLRKQYFVLAVVCALGISPASAKQPHCPSFKAYSDLIYLASDDLAPRSSPTPADLSRLEAKAIEIDTGQIKNQLVRMRVDPSRPYLQIIGHISKIHELAASLGTLSPSQIAARLSKSDIHKDLREARAFLDKFCGRAEGSKSGLGKIVAFIREGQLSAASSRASFLQSTIRLGALVAGLLAAIAALVLLNHLYRLFWANMLVRRSCEIPAQLEFSKTTIPGRIDTLGLRGFSFTFTTADGLAMAKTMRENQSVKLVTDAGTSVAKYTRPIKLQGSSAGFRFYSDLTRSALNEALALSVSPVKTQLKRRLQ